MEFAYGETTAVSVSGTQPALLDLDIKAAKTVELKIRQDEPSLIFRILAEDDREVTRLRSGYPGWIFLSFSTENCGHVRLSISAAKAVADPVSVSVSMERGPASTAALVSQIEAEQTLARANALRTEMTENALLEAIKLYRKAAQKWMAGPNRSGQALALMSEGDTWLQLSRYREALSAYSQVRYLAKHGTTKEVDLLNGEARIYLDMWRHKQARQVAAQALQLSRQINDSIGELYALESLGEAQYYLLDVDESKKTFIQAMELAERENDRVGQARILSIQGLEERTLGRIPRALDAMLKADNLFQQTGDVRGSLSEIFDIATTDNMKGDPYAALITHVKIAKLFHQAGKASDEAYSALGIGEDYVKINRIRDGLEYFRQASRLFLSINNIWVRQASLGMTCDAELMLDLLKDAGKDCTEVKGLSEQYGVSAYIAEADRNLGRLAEARHEDSKALGYYKEAARLTLARFPLGKAEALLSLGELQDRLGDHGAATQSFEQAIGFFQSAEDPVGTLDARYQMAQIKARSGQLKEAQAELDQALELFESQRSKIHDDNLRTSYFASAGRCYGLYVDILMKRHQQDPTAGFDRLALEKSEAGRARTLLDTLVTRNEMPLQKTQSSASPELAHLQAALNEAYENRLNLIMQGKNDQEIQRNAAEIRRLAAEYDQAQNLARDQEKAPGVEAKPLTADQLLDRCSRLNVVILEYELGDKQSYRWRIDHGEVKAAVLADRQTIANAVQKWRDLVAARQRRPGESFSSFQGRVRNSDRELPIQASKLSCMLLAGVAAARESPLVIVASGILQSVPFAALPIDGCTRTDGAPLLTIYEVSSSPSISVLLQKNKTKHEFTGDVAILADPVFSPSDPRVTNRNNGTGYSASPSAFQSALRDVGYRADLPRLTATRKEADAIVSALPSARLLLATDFKASLQTALSEDMSRYRIWHFATHGLLDTKSPDLSGMVFSLVNEEGHPRRGYLKIQDIFDLTISTDLVVLSACNSGLGEQIDGEGTLGLSYAFLHAGAGQVVSTLWNVDDFASSDLMAEFYRRLLTDHLSPEAALRRAQIAMLTKKHHSEPFYWAGYVVTSN